MISLFRAWAEPGRGVGSFPPPALLVGHFSLRARIVRVVSRCSAYYIRFRYACRPTDRGSSEILTCVACVRWHVCDWQETCGRPGECCIRNIPPNSTLHLSCRRPGRHGCATGRPHAPFSLRNVRPATAVLPWKIPFPVLNAGRHACLTAENMSAGLPFWAAREQVK